MSGRAGQARRDRKPHPGGRGRPRPPRPGPETLLGVRSVLEALRAGRRELRRLLVRETRGGDALNEILALALQRGVPVAVLAPLDFDKGVAENALHQGVALEVGALPVISLRELPKAFANAQVLVALDGVEDPQNLGSIARVATAADADGLIVTSRRSAPLGAAASRASAGALEHLPVARVPNLREALHRLQERGFLCVGADPQGEQMLYRTPSEDSETPRVLVLGAEGRGLRPLLRRSLDQRIEIPISQRIQSLNVATAAAVVLFEWRRQRLFPMGNS